MMRFFLSLFFTVLIFSSCTFDEDTLAEADQIAYELFIAENGLEGFSSYESIKREWGSFLNYKTFYNRIDTEITQGKWMDIFVRNMSEEELKNSDEVAYQDVIATWGNYENFKSNCEENIKGSFRHHNYLILLVKRLHAWRNYADLITVGEQQVINDIEMIWENKEQLKIFEDSFANDPDSYHQFNTELKASSEEQVKLAYPQFYDGVITAWGSLAGYKAFMGI